MALFLFWRRSDDWVALLVALLFVLTAAIYSSPIIDAPVPLWLVAIPIGMGETCQAAFVYLFPDGRFVPKWSRWLLLPMFIWRPAIWIITYLPDYKMAFPRLTALTYGYTRQDPLDIGLFIICLLIGIGGQVYRYHRLSTPEQRQQAKWVLYGVSMTVVVVGTWVMAFNVFELAPQDSFATYLGLRVARQLALAIVPVVFAVSILRYRMWDIDFYINRTLVYGIMTFVLGGVFVLILLSVQQAVRLLSGSQDATGLALAMSVLVVVLLFRPVLNRMRRFVDRRFYGIDLDYQRALKAYASRENTVDRSMEERTTFGPFKDMQRIGHGGMGEVFRAFHPGLKRTVAVKILSPALAADAGAHSRFLHEARLLASLSHPNIVGILEQGEIGGQPYMVMDYIDGLTLRDAILQRGRLPFTEVLHYLTDIAEALDYAHRQRVVHRDIKPGNVMIERIQGGEGGHSHRAVLMDFGIAKAAESEEAHAMEAGMMMGTLDYIAPEQIQDSASVDHRADIYSLGVMAYQALCGQLPFRQNNPGALVLAHLIQPPPDPREFAADITPETDYALLRALAKKPAERFASAGEFVGALAA
jgi:tRNA A-37 threonylcarbamoyl transferase component Bud32